MDNLTSEISQKMRSAVKAKLIEIGSAGYIDDELPDYVMIMVANKRSKQQMIDDLNLFLNDNTELFVIWLHEVLQKLQEVTLPTAGVVQQKVKRKAATDVSLPAVVTKKEKKERRKEKKLKRTSKAAGKVPISADVAESAVRSGQTSTPVIPASISDVISDQLLQKAKKNLQIEASAKTKQKKEKTQDSSTQQTDEFDIPTITEMASDQPTASATEKANQLAELAEIQKKIYQAKKHLRDMETESEDEDFLNIKEDLEELDDELQDKNAGNTRNKQRKSPNENDDCRTKQNVHRHKPITFEEDEPDIRDYTPPPLKSGTKKPVHERLGLKNSGNVISLATHRRAEQELYVPVYRRKEIGRERENARDKDIEEKVSSKEIRARDRERNREQERDRDRRPRFDRTGESDMRERIKQRERERGFNGNRERMSRDRHRSERIDIDNVDRLERSARDRSEVRPDREKPADARPTKSPSPNVLVPAPQSKLPIRQRIGSRVVVAPSRPEYNEDEEEQIDKPVNSIVKVKPRTPIPANKQASKNLLMRAVAEAQKSTALVRPQKEVTRSTSPPSLAIRTQKLYTKSYRDRNRESLLNRAKKDNIVIEVDAKHDSRRKEPNGNDECDETEYIPGPVLDHDANSDGDLVYIPQIIDSVNNSEDEIDDGGGKNVRNPTQFVVTLDDKSREKYVPRNKNRLIEQNQNGVEIKRLEKTDEAVPAASRSTGTQSSVLSHKRHHHQRLHSTTTSKSSPIRNSESIQKKPKEVKKIIIKNDSEDDSAVNSSGSPTKKSDMIYEERSTTPPLPPPQHPPRQKSPKETMVPNTSSIPRKRSAVSPIKFDLQDSKAAKNPKQELKASIDVGVSGSGVKLDDIEDSKDDLRDENHKVSIKRAESKYDNIPELLSTVSVESSNASKGKPKERCKYFPLCGKGDSCEFYHPTTQCKSFPNCKFADKCLYIHPKCKFDLTCTKVSCNFSHTPVTPTNAPPLSSHVVPVQNYKSISATPLPAMCKYYPNCTNNVCNFYHPKVCRFGKNCMNKVECNFYHHEIPVKDKFKWVASLD